MKRVPVSLQLWSLNQDCRNDFAATVAAVAKLGYQGVELAGYGNLSAADAAKAVAATGLKVSGMHVGLTKLKSDLPAVMAEAALFETEHIVCPSWPKKEFTSASACQRIGEELNSIGATLRHTGLKFSFHNHDAEFAIVDGRRVLDWILDAAEPRNLGCELDVYWATFAGNDPAAFIREQGRRIELIHLKDEFELGLGPVFFPDVFSTAGSVNAVKWYIVEQEKYHHAPLESVRLCLAQLQQWGMA